MILPRSWNSLPPPSAVDYRTILPSIKIPVKRSSKRPKSWVTGIIHFASSLRKQKTNTIGVIIHELNSNFITSVLAGIEKVTTEAGYDLIIAHSSESYEKEAANALNLFHKRVDGLIASLAFNTKGLDHYRSFEEKGIPMIFFDRVEEKSDSTKVIIDNYKCGYQATKHLIEQGCKKIVLVTASLKRNVYAQRYKGYMDALSDHDIPFEKDLVLIKDLSEQCGVEAAMEILKMKPRPDGAFITNDFSAAVCMQTLKEHGIKIPADIAIVGFNNDAISKIVEPQLDHYSLPGNRYGRDRRPSPDQSPERYFKYKAYQNHRCPVGIGYKKIIT